MLNDQNYLSDRQFAANRAHAQPEIALVAAGSPIALLEAGLILLAVSVLAATGPALRAASSDPARILRRE